MPTAVHEPMMPETFIPPQAERAPVRAPRMPRLEELPMPAQAEIRRLCELGLLRTVEEKLPIVRHPARHPAVVQVLQELAHPGPVLRRD